MLKELTLYGNLKNIKSEYVIGDGVLKNLLSFYSIDKKYIIKVKETEKEFNQYQDIVNFLGHHPTTTELSKKREWRNLWHRIYYHWGSFNKFRKEYNILIPKSAFNVRERRTELKRKILIIFDEHKNESLTRYRIAKILSNEEVMVLNYIVSQCLLELFEENKDE